MNKKKDRFFQKKETEPIAWFHGILLGIAALLFSTAFGLGVICVSNQPFVRDIAALRMPERTGLSADVIFRNYRAVIDFLSPFSKKEFSLPDLAWSPSGASHFADVKAVFIGFYIAGFIGFLICLFFLIRAINRRLHRGTLLISAVTTIALPAVFLSAMAIDFDRAFVAFHHVLFNNMDWIFDPAVDPVILIMPGDYFLHCAFFLGAFWILIAAVQFIAHIALNRQTKR
jgi:integral membrane protein (TIGR01906 family)